MNQIPPQQVSILPDRAALPQAAAEWIAATAQQATAARGRFTIALSGGSTPRDLYALLATPAWQDRIDWTKTLVFWGDERTVPPDHPESNYRLARILLDHVPVQDSQVFRLRGEAADRAAAAAEYEALIRRTVPPGPDGLPRFDLLLLGLGADGHTASLLPGDPLVFEQARLVAVTNCEREGTIRLTVTAPIIQHAARSLFLVAGADKAPALREVLHGPENLSQYPAQIVRRALGEVIWLVDRAAAADLPERER